MDALKNEIVPIICVKVQISNKQMDIFFKELKNNNIHIVKFSHQIAGRTVSFKLNVFQRIAIIEAFVKMNCVEIYEILTTNVNKIVMTEVL